MDAETVVLHDAAGQHPFGAIPPRSHARVWLAVVGICLYGAVVLVATLRATPPNSGFESPIAKLLDVLHRYGVPEWFGYGALEFTANVGLFFPLGFLLALAWPRRAMWATLLLIPAFSGGIELMQAIFLAERYASLLDVLANSLGGYIGAVGAVGAALIRAAVHARDQKVVARAVWLERAAHR